MQVLLSIKDNRPSARFDSKSNALSVLLETEGTGLITHLQNHIMLSKQKEWLGNSTRCQPQTGNRYLISLKDGSGEIILSGPTLLDIILRWHRFSIDKNTQTFDI